MRTTTLLLSFSQLLVASVHGQTAEQIASTFLQPQFGASAASAVQNPPPGPILETGKFDVISSKLFKGADMDQIRRAPVRPMESSLPSDHSSAPLREPLPHLQQQQQPLYRYDGPLDGRKVYIYKKILQPVRITSHGMERLPGAQVIEQWAEGGYGNHLGTQMRAPFYKPITNGLYTQTTGQFVHAK